MPFSIDTINAPVSIFDVQSCFGLSYNDIGRLITYANINKWAKYKPIVRATIDTVTWQWDATNKVWLSTAYWWKGGDGHCGLSFTTFPSLGSLTNSNSFLYKLYHLLLPWTYTKPSGGANSPFRLQDFAQYYHDAVPPCVQLVGAGRTIYVQTTGQGTRLISLNYDAPPEGSENLSLSDFSHNGVSFQSFYLAALMVNGSNYIIVSSEHTIGDTGSTVIDAQIGYDDLGTWQIVPFLSSVQITQQGQLQSGTYISVGYDKLDTIIVASAGSLYMIIATGTWSNTSYTQVGLNVTIENNNSSAKTFTGGLTVYIYETDDDATTGAGGSLVGSWTYSTSFTVQANSNYTIPENLYNQLLDMDFCAYINNLTKREGKEYWVTARFTDGTTVDNQYEPVQDMIMPDL